MRALIPVVAAGTLLGALGTPIPARATPAAGTPPPVCVGDLDAPARGESAVEALGADLPEAAEAAGVTARKLQRNLRSDRTMWVDQCGQPFYVEPNLEQPDTTTSPAATADARTLHSRPGAARTLFLDFDGHRLSGTAWNANYTAGAEFTAEPYTRDSDPAFSQTELNTIADVWKRVAEDYAPFDVDVTTEDPGQDAITRNGSGDAVFGTRVVISPTSTIYSSCRCGGIAYVSVFDTSSSHARYQPAFVFTRGVGTGSKGIAEAASHEAGHNLGLLHDGTATQGYYWGQGAWAPIMGVGYDEPLTQWSRGEYTGANNQQDDLAVIADNGAPRMTDDVGDTAGAATAIEPGSVAGLIERPSDTDWFAFTATGATSIAVTPSDLSPNLDISLALYDDAGAVVASSDPAVTQLSGDLAAGLDADMDVLLAPGQYWLEVDGTGSGSPTGTGYSDYGSLGPYTVSLQTTDALVAVPLTGVQGRVGAPLRAQVRAAGGEQPYSWSADAAPAPGLALATDGTVSGTPTVAGTFMSTLTVTDARGRTATTGLTLQIADPVPTPGPPPVTPSTPPAPSTPAGPPSDANDQPPTTTGAAVLRVVTTRLPVARAGQRYRARLKASTVPGRWERARGTLPAGVRLTRSGTLRGVPARPGRYAFVASVSQGALAAQRAFTLRVRR